MNKEQRKERDKQIKEEFRQLYQGNYLKKLSIYDLIAQKHKLDRSTIQQIIKPSRINVKGNKIKLSDYKNHLNEWKIKNGEQNESK